jgi:hypothetical protein
VLKTLNNIKYPVLILAVTLFLITGCNQEKHPGDHEKVSGGELLDSTVIRPENEEITSLDENGDGMLYQCPMDFQVISDNPGRCPLCKMYLEEYTIEQVQKNFTL